MKKEYISSSLAKKIILNAQLLHDNISIEKGKQGVKQVIEKLGYVQIDTIAVIKRAHHHTLWTRVNDYNEGALHILQAKDRAIFEYWAHAMSYLPIKDYRYFLSRMKNFINPTNQWIKYHYEKSKHIIEPVLDRIKQEGALGAKDFSSLKNETRQGWWDWKPAKSALEFLFWRGDLMVTERKNFQKVYDLTERVLPENIDTSIPSKEEIGEFLVNRALSSFGMASEKEIFNYLQPVAARDLDFQMADKEIIKKSIQNMLESGSVIAAQISGDVNTIYYVFSILVDKADSLMSSSTQVFLLSPFDNLIIQRERTKRIFNFDYTLECYVPVQKRKYGYFVLPILWGDKFVGRFDPKADRKTKTLNINSLFFEPDFIEFDEFLPLFVDKLMMLARFNNCEKIKFKKISVAKIKKNLELLVKDFMKTIH